MDQVKVTNMANPGSNAAVALDVWRILRVKHANTVEGVDAELDLFRKCLEATYGRK